MTDDESLSSPIGVCSFALDCSGWWLCISRTESIQETEMYIDGHGKAYRRCCCLVCFPVCVSKGVYYVSLQM